MQFEYAKGAAYAILSAGPIFLLAFAIGVLATGEGSWRDLSVWLLGLPIILLVAIPVGAIIGTIPIAFGGFVMCWLGQRYRIARHPAAWGLAGSILALPLAMALPLPSSVLELIAPLAATGAICALIVRYGTRWSDDSV